MVRSLPSYKDLPLNPGDPFGSAWGLWGKDDEKGTVNLITDDTVKAAAKEIVTGRRVTLNWPLNALRKPCFGRAPVTHRIFQKAPRIVNDDELSFNTQGSSQIDGLRHFAYQNEQKFYNGVTEDQIIGEQANSTVLGIHAWARAGIIGRGVLIDYARWADEQGKRLDQTTTYGIPLADLLAAAKSQGVEEFRQGDILLVRTGYIRRIAAMSELQLETYASTNPATATGVEQSQEMLSFLWDNHFSAIAGDAISFEAWPTQKDYAMHEVILSGWGMPLGELWDLEELSEYCHQQKRNTFFLTSVPLNQPGGVASPPNAVAIF